jgi:hypothetical protein
MKASSLILLFLAATQTPASAQIIPKQALEDSLIGWMKVYKFTGTRPAMTVDAKRYSAAQLAIADSLANWVQASYTPKGALGDVLRIVSPKLGLYNQSDAALPQTYGAYAKSYTELRYNRARKLEPVTDSHLYWSVSANGVFGEPLRILNSPTQHYFLLPGFNPEGKSTPQNQRYDRSDHPALKGFITYFNGQLRSSRANATFVLLTRDRKLPFITISKAEYLDKLAGAVERKHAAEKAEAVKSWPEGKIRVTALEQVEDRYRKRVGLLAVNREKYAARLREPAAVFSLQPTELVEHYQDVFEGSGGPGERYPVYTIDPAMAELAKTDQPQWILVTWDGDILDPVGKQLSDAIVGNFDFQYVQDFFFAPERVKGRPYRPLRSPEFREPVVVTEASEAARRNASNAAVHFFEDFSTTPVGRVPNGWTIGRTSGTVTSLDGLPGHWVLMAGEAKLTPKLMKSPLPGDFTLSYELVAAQNFAWGAKGLTLELANAGSSVSVRLRPGFDGRNGEAEIERKAPAGYESGTKWAAAPGFSNDKLHNRITVTIRKAGETLQVFIDANKIAEYPKALPAGLRFDTVSFSVLSSPTDLKDKFYVGNIKIAKE